MRRRLKTDDSAWRAQRRVLHHAREMVEEAIVERHNPAFYGTLVRAARALLLELGEKPGFLAMLIYETLEEEERGQET